MNTVLLQAAGGSNMMSFFTNGFDHCGILFLHDQTTDEEAKRP